MLHCIMPFVCFEQENWHAVAVAGVVLPVCLLAVVVVDWNVWNKGDGAQSGALVDEAHNNTK